MTAEVNLPLLFFQYFYNDTEITPASFNPATFSPTVSANSPLRVVVDHSANTTTWYTYDELGQVKKVQNQQITTTQTLDDYGRASSETSTLANAIVENNYIYADAYSNDLSAESVTVAGTTTTTTYSRDGLQRPTETTIMQGNYGYKQAFEYIPRQTRTWVSGEGFGPILTAIEPNGPIKLPIGEGYWRTDTVGTTQYVSTFKEYSVSGTTETLVRTDTVEYDANGNITKYGNVTYEYDKLGRLVRENNPTTDIDKTTTWCYDVGGNIVSKIEYAYTTGDLAAVTPTHTFTYTYDTNWKDQLVEIKKNGVTQHTFDYDQAGNPTTYKGVTLTWERGRLLASYNSIEMEYDANGIRRTKQIPSGNNAGTTTYVYNGSNLVYEKQELSNKLNCKYFLYNNQGIVGFVYNTVTYMFRKNLFGDITAIYRGGTKVAEYAYDAWGNCTIKLDTNGIGTANPFRYRGYYWDNDIQLYYLMSRYYDPVTGRFVNADSLEYLDPETIGGLNLYAYCGNNPVMGVDPTGQSWESFWNSVGDWFSDHANELIIGTAFIVAGALVTALTAGAGVSFMAALGSALLSSVTQVGISIATGVITNGLSNIANNQNFFDNVGDTIASSYMWGGIFSGGSQILGGGFRAAANKGVPTGRKAGIRLGKSNIKVLSPDKNNWTKAGGTLIKFGSKFRLDTGAMWGLHMHILNSSHIPLGAFLAGIIGR